MKKDLLIILGFCLLSLSISGQQPLDVSNYLTSPNISKNAIDYYHNKFKASDDDKTFSIIDSLKTKNNLTRPFYIFLVSKMLKNSDGALSEVLGIACKDFIEWHPNYALDFLYFSGGSSVKSENIDLWAEMIAGEFKIDCEGKEKQCAEEFLKKAMGKCKVENRKNLTEFYKRVGKYCQ